MPIYYITTKLHNYITPKIYLSKILHFSKEKNR